MNLRYIKHYLFFLLLISFAETVLSQKIDLNKALVPVIIEIKDQYPVLAKNNLLVEKFNVDLSKESLQIYLNKNFGNIPYRENSIKLIYDRIRTVLPEPLNKYEIQIFIANYPIEDLIPNFYLERKKIDKSRIPPILPANDPIVKNEDRPYEITKGLAGKHLAVWHSHGWYYEPTLDLWQWQRARLHQTVEDIYTMAYTIPYLIPMLENAGAYVFVPRERDTQLNEIIVDNDEENSFFYEEAGGSKESWEKGNSAGFANTKEIYAESENPFQYGTYRQIKSKRNGDAYAEWTPDIPEKGEYAVYIAYHTLAESSKDAQYTVFHSGGKTEFKVNQTMGGGTWIYLGTFEFDEGVNPESGKVRLTNESKENNKIITVDAVRFGGGIGNIGRTKNGTQKQQQIKKAEVSGRARYLEGARYWLQWAGFNDSIYNLNNNQNDYKDDYMCRGAWVNNLIGGSVKLPDMKGKNIPIDLVLGFHTDAGLHPNDSVIGTMCIYMTDTNNRLYANKQRRISSRDLADLVQSEVVSDIQTFFRQDWTRRILTDQSYYEARVPEVPTLLLELLSHQNFTDMQYGLDPNFRFMVSRSIYKGILKFMASQYETDYVVQPLPVTHFSIEFIENDKLFLSWKEQIDPYEPTARPQKYIVYTSAEENGFDNGIITSEPQIIIPIDSGKIYNFKVTAINEGGESFPSETLSACRLSNTDKTILIVNGFHRVSAPASFDNGANAGFLDCIDQGVPDKYDISYTGSQYIFDKTVLFESNENPGYGASYAGFENDVIAGNTFNFPHIHGKSVKDAGYSFTSCSDDAVMSGKIGLNDYFGIDLILGEEKETQTGKEKKYKLFQKPMRDALSDYLKSGGNLFVSGAYIGSDIWERDVCDPNEIEFAEKTLRYKWKQSKASTNGKLSNVSDTYSEFDASYSFCTNLNNKQYAVESPDAIEPVNESFSMLTYEENNLPACVGYRGSYRTLVAAFPFESINTEESRNSFMKEVLRFFER